MKLTLKIITPTIIRSGDEISTVSECVIEDNKLRIIDKEKLSQYIKGNKNLIMELSNMIIRGENIGNFIKEYKINLDSITKYTLPINENIDSKKRKNIYLPLTSSDRAYIPGSTIKGIIRNALLFDFFSKNKAKIDAKINELEEQTAKKQRTTYAGEDVLRSDGKDAGTDIMKFIIVRDSSFIEFEKLKVYEIVRIPHKKLSQLIIAIPPKNDFTLEININKYTSYNIPEQYRTFLENNPEEKLWNIMKTYSLSLMEKEIEILERLKEKDNQTKLETKKLFEDLLIHYDNMLKRVKEKDVIFIPIGFGKTYYFNSLGYFIPEAKLKNLKIIKNKTDPKYYPSTRWAVKLGEKYYPLGWCGVVKNE